MVGTACGVYIAQNYNIPNMKKLGNCGLLRAKQVEQSYRKPNNKNPKDDDDDLQPPR